VIVGGRYEVRETLGRGGAATVYRAVDLKLQREVALKVFTTDEITGVDEEQRARRTREIGLLARANHPNLVTLFDADRDFEQPGTEFIVMELVRGATLRHRLRTDGPDAALAAQLTVELAAALAYLHADGIIHRDLKPENILLNDLPDGTVVTKLVDFGIAQLLGDERLTSGRSILGTAAYLAPEQVSGAGATTATDVYALGLVLLECLTGERSFPGTPVEAAIARVTQDPPMPAGLHPEWQRLLTAMTARYPTERPTAAEVAETAAALPPDLALGAIVPVQAFAPVPAPRAAVTGEVARTAELVTAPVERDRRGHRRSPAHRA
jgi:serine/threonine protein kinase